MHTAVSTRRAATLALTGIAWWVATILALPLINTDYDPLRETISDLALYRGGALLDVAFLVLGLAGLALAWALWRVVPNARIATALLAAAAVLWASLSIFQSRPGGIEYAIHGAAAALSFLLILVAMFRFARDFRRDPHWRGFARPTLAWACLATGLIAFLPWLGSAAIGLWERAFVATWLSWLVVLAVGLRRWGG